ncbi:MAG: twin-arginine translocase TatA/TatE family subunit [Alphaproteobacteria bacterium]|nr:twin-arginine translocase TatA/TatE family subunit [Alphaproteobacteria bacterium]
MAISWVQVVIIAFVVLLLFGRGKISDLMGDVAKGIKSFKKGLSDDEPEGGGPVDVLDSKSHLAARPSSEYEKKAE